MSKFLQELNRLEQEAGVPLTKRTRAKFRDYNAWLHAVRALESVTLSGVHQFPEVTYTVTDSRGNVLGEFTTLYDENNPTKVLMAGGHLNA